MSKSQRLSSFNKSSPARVGKQLSVPNSPQNHAAGVQETSHHRTARSLLLEMKEIAQTWQTLLLVDGIQSMQRLIDTRTELQNLLSTQGWPRKPLMRTSLEAIDDHLYRVNSVLTQLKRLFVKIVKVVAALEALISQVHRSRGWRSVAVEPLWHTWTLEHFYNAVTNLLPVYHMSLFELQNLYAVVEPNDVSFEHSRLALNKWSSQAEIGEAWTELDQLFAVEVERWAEA